MTGFDPRGASLPHQKLYGDMFSDKLRAGAYLYFDRPAVNPLIFQNGTQTAPVTVPTWPTAVQDNVNSILVPGAFGNRFIEMYQTTAQTLMPSRDASKGLEIGLDEVDNESVEYVPGGNHGVNPMGYLAGTDLGVRIKAVVQFADVSGSDQFFVGWRKQEAYAVPTSFLSTGDAAYTDFVGIGFSGSTGAVKTMSDVGNTGSTTVFDTGFAVADDDIVAFEVRLSGRRAAFFINGVRCGDAVAHDGIGAVIASQNTKTPTAYTVTSGLFMIPMIFSRYDTTTPGTIHLRSLLVAPLQEDSLIERTQ